MSSQVAKCGGRQTSDDRGIWTPKQSFEDGVPKLELGNEFPDRLVQMSSLSAELVPKLQLGNAHSGSSASRPPKSLLGLYVLTGREVRKSPNVRRLRHLDVEAELRGRRSQAGAWERVS